MLKYFSQHLTKFFMSRDSFSETTVTPKDPSSEIFNHFQNIIVTLTHFYFRKLHENKIKRECKKEIENFNTKIGRAHV